MRNTHWHSVHGKEGGHYNSFSCMASDGMAALRDLFPEAEADEFNQCLFSTSGVHGTCATIEEAEADWSRGCRDEDGDPTTPEVTFLILQPRLCTVRFGNCQPQSADDFAFLKDLRASSWRELTKIGAEP